MAKNPITEKITESHKLTTEGYLNTENMTVEILDLGVIDIADLLANFNSKYVKVSIEAKEEKPVNPTEE